MFHSLPVKAGIGLRAVHYEEVLLENPELAWVEVHSENFFGGGAPLDTLLKVASHYPVSLHGVGMGLASPMALNKAHLAALKQLCEQVKPSAISEHLSWNSISTGIIPDLLPFPYTELALKNVVAKVLQVQDYLNRPLLIENLSYYLMFQDSEFTEQIFLSELVSETDCGILLDINNLYVNAVNLDLDAYAFIRDIPAHAVAEYHLAGASWQQGCLVDTHSQQVQDEVWDLYQYALLKIGVRPTLIEWDMDIPALSVLQAEAKKADFLMQAGGV